MVNEGYLAEDDVLADGQDVMRYLQSHWFDDPAYLRIAGQLEIVQDARRSMQADGFLFRPEDLQLPLRLFTLRNAYAQDEAVQVRLDEVFHALIGGEVDAASQILSGLSSPG